MSSYRLTTEQIARLKSRACPASDILNTAWVRWKGGEFSAEAIQNAKNKLKAQNVLQVFPVRHRFLNVNDRRMRVILQCHFDVPMAKVQTDYRQATEFVARLYQELTTA